MDTNLISQPHIKTEYKKRKKSFIVAYYFCLLMSGFGLHKFYLGDKKQAVRFVSLYWTGLAIFMLGFFSMDTGQPELGQAIFALGLLSLTLFGVWWIIDILTLHIKISRKNRQILNEIISQSSYS